MPLLSNELTPTLPPTPAMVDGAPDHQATSSAVQAAWCLLSVIGFTWWCIIWAICLLGCRVARTRFSHAPASPLSSAPASAVPGVSILRPLKGIDCNLYENLESCFLQDYPKEKYEIIFSVSHQNDQALPVVAELLRAYPDVNARVIVGEEVVGVNPKINNLVRPYREAAHDILWVLDSNVSVSRGTLARAVDALVRTPPGSKPIGLVHHVPFAVSPSDCWGARVEQAFLNTTHAKMYLAINAVAIDSCVMGKSNLYRRSDIERLPLLPGESDDDRTSLLAAIDGPSFRGLARFGRYLAEDNMLASAIWHDLSLRHSLPGGDRALTALGDMDLSTYFWRRVRWIRVRKRMVTAATLLEPLTESLVAGLVGVAAAHALLDGCLALPRWLFFLLHEAAWYALDQAVLTALQGHPLPADQRWDFFRAWALREILALPIWAFAMAGNTVGWRDKKYRVARNGQAEDVPPPRRPTGGRRRPAFLDRLTAWRRPDDGEARGRYERLSDVRD